MAEKFLKCPNCGAGNPEGKKFCGDCGAMISEPPQPVYKPETAGEAIMGTSGGMKSSASPTENEKLLAYVLSLFVPILGFILGVLWLTYPMGGFKKAGRNCILIALVPALATLLSYLIFR